MTGEINVIKDVVVDLRNQYSLLWYQQIILKYI